MNLGYENRRTVWTKRVLVRPEYSDESVWRETLGFHTSLYPFSTDGPLDAPDWIPKGGLLSEARFETYLRGS